MKVPRTPTFTLTGIADKIQTLQSIISGLSWIDYSFGMAERYEKLVGDETHIIPVVFVDNTTDPIDMRPFPYDTFTGYAFWHVDDPGEVLYNDGAEHSVRKYATWQYKAALIAMADARKIDDSPYNEVKALLKQDILSKLQNNVSILMGFWIDEVFERDIIKIFDPYTIEKPQEILKYPFVGFRFNCTIQFKQLCPINNSYSVTTRN